MEGVIRRLPLSLVKGEFDTVGEVFAAPFAEEIQNRHNGSSLFRERVFHPRGDLRIHFPGKKTARFQFTQFFGQHPRGDFVPPGIFLDLTIPSGAVHEGVQNQCPPFSADDIQCRINSALIFTFLRSFRSI